MGLIMVFLVLLPGVFSLTGKLGSAKAIITVEVPSGEPAVVERHMTVINDNNETIRIYMFPADGLTNITQIPENNFTLLPGESRNASYIFTISETGRYDGSIRVKFTPEDVKGPGVGLDGTFIVFAIPKNESITPANEDTSAGNGSILTGIIIAAAIVGIGIGAYALLRRGK